MAILEGMTESKGQGSPRRSKAFLRNFSNEFASPSPSLQSNNVSDDAEVVDADFISKLESMSGQRLTRNSKSQYITPGATPVTAAETPVSEDSSAGSDFNPSRSPSPLYQSKSAFTKINVKYGLETHTSSSLKVVTKTPSSKNLDDLFQGHVACESTRQQGRALFRESPIAPILPNSKVASDSAIQPDLGGEERLRSSRASGPATPTCSNLINGSDNNQFRTAQTEMESSNSRSLRIRSRRQHLTDSETPPSKSLRADRRRRSRRRPSTSRSDISDTNGSIFSLSVVSIEDEVSVSSDDDSNMELSNSSYRRRGENSKNHSRQQNKSVSLPIRADLSGNGHDQNVEHGIFGPIKKLTMKRLATTKVLVWLLCLVGITSVSMIILTNHRITKSLDSNGHGYNDHVTVLFRKRSGLNSKNRNQSTVRRNGLEVTSLDMNQGEIKNVRRKVVSDNSDKSFYSAVSPINLHKLSHFHEQQMKDNEASNDNKEKRDNPNHINMKGQPKENIKSHTHNKQNSRDDSTTGKQTAKQVHAHGKSKEYVHRHKHQTAAHAHHHHNPTRKKTTNEQQNEDNKEITVADSGHVATPTGWVRPETILRKFNPYLYKESLPSLSGGQESNRIVMLGNFVGKLNRNRGLAVYPSPFTDNTQVYPILDSRDDEDARIKTMEVRAPYSEGECVPMADWQTTFNPSCNGMHELDVGAVEVHSLEEDFTLFGKNGFWRNAWKYEKIHRGSFETVVLKTLK
jgi:hypothetical protein